MRNSHILLFISGISMMTITEAKLPNVKGFSVDSLINDYLSDTVGNIVRPFAMNSLDAVHGLFYGLTMFDY